MDDVIQGLKEKYSDVHPLIFNRTKEKSKTAGEMFTILSKIPNKFPLVWSEEEKLWVHTKDLFQSATL